MELPVMISARAEGKLLNIIQDDYLFAFGGELEVVLS